MCRMLARVHFEVERISFHRAFWYVSIWKQLPDFFERLGGFLCPPVWFQMSGVFGKLITELRRYLHVYTHVLKYTYTNYD